MNLSFLQVLTTLRRSRRRAVDRSRLARAIALLAPLSVAACSGADADPAVERVGQTSEPLAAYCQANVNGVGLLDAEKQYLPNVVHCENGGAPLEALKVQAIAARTYLYYKMETAGSIGDGQGDQVYSCGSSADALQKQAVADTAGLVLRYSGQTIAAFYVAGGAASPPSCHGGSAGTESYVTYNEGLSGTALHQSTLGWVNTGNHRNRGCMSQLGSRCLANLGKGYEDILHFYYGEDIVIERATGSCIAPPPAPTPTPTPTPSPEGDAGSDANEGEDAGTSGHDAGSRDAGAPKGSPVGDDEAAPYPSDPWAGMPTTNDGCSVGHGHGQSSTAAFAIAMACALFARRRRDSQSV